MTEFEQLRTAIESRIASDPKLRALRKKFAKGTADMSDSAKYSQLCSRIMGQKLSERVLELVDREGVCTQLLRDRYSDINGVCEAVQRSLDEKNGISMNPRRAAFPTERVQQLAHSLVDPTVPDETIRRRADKGAANAAMSFHDDFVSENVSVRSNAGYECFITRVTGGRSCPWCSALAGRYPYDEMPEDIFRRHDNCTCTVTFEQGAFRQNVWTKRSWEMPEVGNGAPKPTVFSQGRANELEQQSLAKIRGLIINTSSIDNSGESGIIDLNDNDNLYKPVTQEAIDRVPKLDIFDDDEMNQRHQQAAKDLLTEVKRRDDVPVGTEFSIRYDKDMKPLKDESYRKGKRGSVKLDDMDIPYHAFHNHGSDQTLSYNDLRKFANSDNMLSLTAQGNLGSVFSIVSSDDADKIGYRSFLNIIGDEKIYEIKGTPISLSFLSDSANESKAKELISLLSPNQRRQLSKAIISQSEKCLNGGGDYGIKYFKAKLAE